MRANRRDTESRCMPRLAREDDAMLATHTQPQRQTASRALAWVPRALLVAIALAWVALLFALLPGARPAPAQARALHQVAAMNQPTTGKPSVTSTPTTAPADSPTAPPASTATAVPPTATASSGSTQSSGGGSQAPTPITTRIDLSQPTLGTTNSTITSTFTPSNLASNGLAIFTALGCIVGVIGLLAVGITWITLVSDGWGPLLKAVVRGNRRGKLRFTRKGAERRVAKREQAPVSASRSRDGWR